MGKEIRNNDTHKNSTWDGILGRPRYMQRLGFQTMHIKVETMKNIK
jgi:hypothetical protein